VSITSTCSLYEIDLCPVCAERMERAEAEAAALEMLTEWGIEDMKHAD
jgi:hypothetical protein